MNPFHYYLYVVDGDIIHLSDTRSIRQPTLCGLVLATERTDQIIDAPICMKCTAVDQERVKIHPTNTPWSRRWTRRLDRYLKRLRPSHH